MVSSVPGCLAWPLLVLMAIALGLRYALCNSSLIETYLNNVLIGVLGCNVLREQPVVDFLAGHGLASATVTGALSGTALNVAFVEFLGFTKLWSGASPQTTRRRHWYWRAAAVVLLVPVFLFAISGRVRPSGSSGYEASGWNNVVVALSVLQMLLPVYLVFQVLRLSAREWTRRDMTRRERMVSAYLVAVIVIVIAVCVGTVLTMIFLGHYPTSVGGYIVLLMSFVFFVLAAIPLVGTVIVRAGLDATSRNWRALQRLQRALAAAAPESVFVTQTDLRGRRRTSLDLHQSIVQIRDGILLLRPYRREITKDEAIRFFPSNTQWRHGELDAAILALQLVDAIRVKASGKSPGPGRGVALGGSSPASLAEEVTDLVRVCKWWPAAQAAMGADIQRPLPPTLPPANDPLPSV